MVYMYKPILIEKLMHLFWPCK